MCGLEKSGGKSRQVEDVSSICQNPYDGRIIRALGLLADSVKFEGAIVENGVHLARDG